MRGAQARRRTANCSPASGRPRTHSAIIAFVVSSLFAQRRSRGARGCRRRQREQRGVAGELGFRRIRIGVQINQNFVSPQRTQAAMLGCPEPRVSLAARRGSAVCGRRVQARLGLRRAARSTREEGVVVVASDRRPLLTSSVPAEVLGARCFAILASGGRIFSVQNFNDPAQKAPSSSIQSARPHWAICGPRRCRTGDAEGCCSASVPNLGSQVSS